MGGRALGWNTHKREPGGEQGWCACRAMREQAGGGVGALILMGRVRGDASATVSDSPDWPVHHQARCPAAAAAGTARCLPFHAPSTTGTVWQTGGRGHPSIPFRVRRPARHVRTRRRTPRLWPSVSTDFSSRGSRILKLQLLRVKCIRNRCARGGGLNRRFTAGASAAVAELCSRAAWEQHHQGGGTHPCH